MSAAPSTQAGGLRHFIRTSSPGMRAVDARAEGANVAVVAGGKGGVGTSLVAALLAAGAAMRGTPTLLVDGNEAVGTLHLLLGVRPAGSLASLRGGHAAPADVLVPVAEGLTLLPGGAADAAAELSGVERRSLFRRVAELYPGFGLVVVDAGSRLDAVLGACAAGAGRLVAVTTPEPIAAAATYALVKAVAARHPALAASVLVNRHEGGEGAAPEAVAQHIAQGAAQFLAHEVGYAGAVPEDLMLRRALASGINLLDALDGSPAIAAAAHELAGGVVGKR